MNYYTLKTETEDSIIEKMAESGIAVRFYKDSKLGLTEYLPELQNRILLTENQVNKLIKHEYFDTYDGMHPKYKCYANNLFFTGLTFPKSLDL